MKTKLSHIAKYSGQNKRKLKDWNSREIVDCRILFPFFFLSMLAEKWEIWCWGCVHTFLFEFLGIKYYILSGSHLHGSHFYTALPV